MTGKERFIGAIEHTPIDRVPRYDAFWEETQNEYGKTSQELAAEFDFDAIMIALEDVYKRQMYRLPSSSKMVSSFWLEERVLSVAMDRTCVWPLVNRPEPWTLGKTLTSAESGRISFMARPSTRLPCSSQAFTTFFWIL